MVMVPHKISREDWARGLGALGYRPVEDRTIDFASEDGSFVIEVQERPRAAVRDLRATLLQLSAYLASHPRIERACVLLAVDGLTPKRLKDEWADLMSVLRAEVAGRLALVAVSESFRLCLPSESARLVELAETGQALLAPSTPPQLPRLPKSLEVLKVLVVRWLLGQGPIPRGELGEQAGCSYPTVARAIERFGEGIREHSNRSVGLRVFPREAWSELLALAPSHRASIGYADRTGRRPDPEALLRRLQKLEPPQVALGGVAAAHHWDPHFDLRGLPRLDLSLAAEGGLDLSFLRRLDPGLGPSEGQGPPVLVIHPLQRPAALFAPGDGFPVADPVETLLDLSELRLVDQSNALIERLERRAREST
ncbi:MAG: hypothetical protein H8E31_12760 [Planctomycetes bacterium]|nr:hypothetical protein [Planctomycetota bacterium]